MRNLDRGSGVRLILLAALVSTIIVASVAAPASARPPPQEVCVACSESFVGIAEENGVEVAVAESSLSIEIDRSGDGHWTERIRLTGEDVDALRTDQTLREQLIAETVDHGYVAVDDPEELTTSMENGDTLVVKYEVREMAHRSAGNVTVVDFFYWHGGEARWFSLAADSMTMRGPPGTVVTHAPADATVVGHAVTWDGSDQRYDPLATRSHVAFAPNDGVVAQAATSLGIGIDVAQLKAGDLLAVVAPLVILAMVLALLVRFGRSLASLRRTRLVGIVVGPIVAVGLVAATIETLLGVSGPLTAQLDDFLFFLVYVVAATGAGAALVLGGLLVIGQLLLARRLLETASQDGITAMKESTRRLLVWPTVLVLAAQWLLFPIAAAGASGFDATYGVSSLVLPSLYFVPLAVTRRQDWVRSVLSLGIVLAPFPIVIAFAPHTGMEIVIRSLALQYVPWALVVVGLGTLGYATTLGMRSADQ